MNREIFAKQIKNALFECDLLQKKTETKPKKKYKPIPLDKYTILSEKEAIIAFMCEIAPYATLKRISNGRDKGGYRVKAKFMDFTNIELSNLPYQNRNNSEIVNGYMESLKCDFANFSYHSNCPSRFIGPNHTTLEWEVTLEFKIKQSFRESIAKEYELNIK